MVRNEAPAHGESRRQQLLLAPVVTAPMLDSAVSIWLFAPRSKSVLLLPTALITACAVVVYNYNQRQRW
jgi:hypothetical protein